jgi:recombinational DNA repair ATPase RecF
MIPTSLYLDAFRGAVKPFTFLFQRTKGARKHITILYGPNGSGKTTLVDALDVLANDNSSLSDKSLGSVGNKPLVSVGRSAHETIVRLETTTGRWTATLDGNKVKVSPTTSLPTIRVLRRTDLAGLLNEAAGKRYERFGKFIDTAVIEKGEAALRKALSAAKISYEGAAQQYSQIVADLTTEWETAGKPEGTLKAWAKAVKDASLDEKTKWKNDWDSVVAQANTLASEAAALTKSRELLQTARAQFSAAQTAQQNAREAVTDETLRDLTGLLREAKHFIQQHPDQSICPLCEQPAAAMSISQRIDARMATLSGVEKAEQLLNSANQALKTGESTIANDTERTAAALSNFIQAFHSDLRSPFAAFTGSLSDRMENFAKESGSEDVIALAGAIALHLNTIATRARAERDLLQSEISRHDSMVRRISEAQRHKRIRDSQDKMHRRLEAALVVVDRERKAYVEGLLAAISQEASDIYDSIHPDEELGKVKFILDPNKRASLSVAGPFLSQAETNPAAYYSEAHVDTLGFAIVMADALRQSPENTILVLDDVISSVDEVHMERLVRSLYQVSSRFAHVLVTTHYRPWKEKFRMGLLRHKDADIIELYDSPITEGLAIGSLRRPERELLRELLASGEDLQSIAAKAGVLLEQLLYFIAHVYACPLPCGKHQDGWTLGEYLNGMNKELKKAMNTQRSNGEGALTGEAVKIGEMLDELGKHAKLRNVVGCHFNQLAAMLPESDAMKFGTEVLALADALVDHDGELPTNDEAGQCWASSSGGLRLYPHSTHNL